MNDIIHFWMGPVIGGIIGYCTNYIAIKMLFKPREAIYIGKYHVPFTPGIIPKRKNELAGKIGQVVSETMFTQEDISSIFLSDAMKKEVGKRLTEILYDGEEPFSLIRFLDEVMSEEESLEIQNHIDHMLTEKVREVVDHTDIEGLVTKETRKLLTEKAESGIAHMVLNRERINMISQMVGTQLSAYTEENAEAVIMPLLRQEVANIFVSPMDDLVGLMDISRQQQEKILEQVYEHFILNYSREMAAMFDIAGLTEKKIIEFQMEEIEGLVQSTIKKEMQAVINLGAVLGVIIGFVNSIL